MNPAMGAITYGPVQWSIADGGNGHYYELVDYQQLTAWTTARDDAASTTLFGSTGHLVTVTSPGEDAFLSSTFQSYIGDPNTNVPGIYAWIGLSDAANEGNYVWVTGEPFTYSNWAPTEPNNNDEEDYVHLWKRNFGSGPLWSWNDADDYPAPNQTFSGALIEFDGPFTTPVPEPSTFALWSLATLGLIVRTRLNKNSRTRSGRDC